MESPPTGLGRALPQALPRAGGTYGLGLSLKATTQSTIGALGSWTLPEGIYIYVGSAWGPGGLKARVGRHLRGSTTVRWHIDYLRQWATPISVWLAPGERLECIWAQSLTDNPTAEIVVPRFGASDCRCVSHLFQIEQGALAALTLPGSPQWLSQSTEGLWR
jgi:Uri superfamily endonuclease